MHVVGGRRRQRRERRERLHDGPGDAARARSHRDGDGRIDRAERLRGERRDVGVGERVERHPLVPPERRDGWGAGVGRARHDQRPLDALGVERAPQRGAKAWLGSVQVIHEQDGAPTSSDGREQTHERVRERRVAAALPPRERLERALPDVPREVVLAREHHGLPDELRERREPVAAPGSRLEHPRAPHLQAPLQLAQQGRPPGAPHALDQRDGRRERRTLDDPAVELRERRAVPAGPRRDEARRGRDARRGREQRGERDGELIDRRDAQGRVGRERAQRDRERTRLERRHTGRHDGQRPREARGEALDGTVHMRWRAAQDGPERRAERVHVATDRRGPAHEQLGRHEPRRPTRRLGDPALAAAARQPEVDDVRVTGAIDDDVPGLQVPVHDALPVERRDDRGDARHERDALFDREPGRDAIERVPVDVTPREEWAAGVVAVPLGEAEVEDARDARQRDLREHHELALERGAEQFVGARGEALQRDRRTAADTVLDEVDAARRPCAERPQHVVAARGAHGATLRTGTASHKTAQPGPHRSKKAGQLRWIWKPPAAIARSISSTWSNPRVSSVSSTATCPSS